ncbi:hypothetical protein ACLOJK_029066 [Asimina triloba]
MHSAIRAHQRLLRLLLQRQNIFLSPSSHFLQIHAQLITAGLYACQSLLFPLLDLIASNPKTLQHAELIFTHIHRPTVSAWRIMVRRHASHGDPCRSLAFFRSMQMERGETDSASADYPFLCASVIKACGKILAAREAKSVHGHALRLGLDSNLGLQNTLIHFYAHSLNLIRSACSMFDGVTHRNIVTVNCMISGFLKSESFHMSLTLFKCVLDGSLGGQGLEVNDVTLLILISGCAELGDLVVGKSLQAYCFKIGTLGTSVCNAFIDLYAKFGRMEGARKVFKEMPHSDLVSWNTMIAGFGKNGACDEAVEEFKEMRCRGLEGDELTLVSLISACAQCKNLDMGQWVHSHMKRMKMVITVPIVTALINMYSKCGFVKAARDVFDSMFHRNIAAFNSMISGYVECACYAEALSLFNVILWEGLKPDEVTILGLISACRDSGSLNHGRQIHSYIKRNGYETRIVLGNALIDMYAKCGSMSRAKRIFEEMSEKDVISWTSVIVGHAINGEGEEGLVSFHQMLAARVEPNGITFIGVLSACDHAGLVEDGQHMFQMMSEEYGIAPAVEHYGCMVDLFARSGLLEEAHEFVREMKIEPNAIIWRMLIGACKIHVDVVLGAHLADGLLELGQLNDPEDYVISSNMFATAGRWDDASRARRLMLSQKITKIPGTSLISGVT